MINANVASRLDNVLTAQRNLRSALVAAPGALVMTRRLPELPVAALSDPNVIDEALSEVADTLHELTD